MAADRNRAAETAAVVDRLFLLMPMVVDHVNERLEEFGMTNTDYWALRTITGPMPMKELAHCMDFDPSYVTMVVDRLETLELVERQPHPTDRRVKNLVLTEKGLQMRNTLPGKLWSGSNTFSSLTDDERARFAELLDKMVAANQP